MILSCEICIKNSKANKKQPLTNHEISNIPWYKVGADLFQYKTDNYLIIVDYYSKYVEIKNLKDNTVSNNVINCFKEIFSRQGIPKILVTDNGPQFISKEFKDFSKEWEFKHVTSSPRYPQSNGQVERTVQTIKNILTKTEEEGKM